MFAAWQNESLCMWTPCRAEILRHLKRIEGTDRHTGKTLQGKLVKAGTLAHTHKGKLGIKNRENYTAKKMEINPVDSYQRRHLRLSPSLLTTSLLCWKSQSHRGFNTPPNPQSYAYSWSAAGPHWEPVRVPSVAARVCVFTDRRGEQQEGWVMEEDEERRVGCIWSEVTHVHGRKCIWPNICSLLQEVTRPLTWSIVIFMTSPTEVTTTCDNAEKFPQNDLQISTTNNAHFIKSL